MTLTEKFQALDMPEQIGLLLALAVIIVPLAVWAWRQFIDYCDAQPIYEHVAAGIAEQQRIAAEYVEKRMPACLRLYARCTNHGSKPHRYANADGIETEGGDV